MRRHFISLAASAALFVAGPASAGMVPSAPSGQLSSWLNGSGPIRDTGFMPEFGYGPMFSSGGKGAGGSGGSGGGGGQGSDGSGPLADDSSQKDRNPFALLPDGLFPSPTSGSSASLGTGVTGGFVNSIPSEPAPVQSDLGLTDAHPNAPNSPLLPGAVSPTAQASPFSQNPPGQGGLNANNGIGTDSNSLQLPGDTHGMTPPLPGSSPVSPVDTFGGDAPAAAVIGPIQPLGSVPGGGFGSGSGGANSNSIQPNIAAVPEPASLVLCCLGVAGALGTGLRRRFAKL